MKLAASAVAATVLLGLGSGTASAQYPTLVPHRGHYHVVPTYSPPVVSGYGYPSYSPGVPFGGYSSPGFGIGGYNWSSGFGGFYGRPSFYGGYGRGGHHHHHHGHHHGHHHHGHHR